MFPPGFPQPPPMPQPHVMHPLPPGYPGYGHPPPMASSHRRGRKHNSNRPPPPPDSDIDSDVNAANEYNEIEDLEEAIEKGSRCNNRDVYRVPLADDPKKFHWVEEKPLTYGVVSDPVKTKKVRETYAVNLFHRFDDQTEEWYVSEIRINSPLLHSVLEKVLEGYPGVTQHELTSFSAPFLPFFHRWQDLLDYSDGLDATSETSDHLQLLEQVMEPLLTKSFEAVRDINKTGHVAFKDLALLLIPDTLVVRREPNAAAILRSCHRLGHLGDSSFYQMSVETVDWDGRRCGLLSNAWVINEYYGLRALSALDIAPLVGLPDEQALREKLIQRGRAFEKLRGQFFMALTDDETERTNVRMVVDAKAYYKYQGMPPQPLASLSERGQLTWDQSMGRMGRNPVPMMPVPGKPVAEDLSELTDEQCLLAVPTVKCFNIAKKMWEFVQVEKLHEIPWAQRAFDSLVLDQSEKDLVLALVDRDQAAEEKRFDDFIDGKGQGMIMLLCGPPGVGKTLTAETVSEHLRRPLYRLGAGDLGIDARAVETCLDTALKLCAEFGAVLLLDEADVFMEARTSNSLQRNELVSVFLRLLEYYNGIMILTTNRMHSIDPAFESRIDITLTYNSLTEADRKQVWQNFLATLDAKDVNISPDELLELAKWDFNGRQIKSAIKTARTLAGKKREPLNAQHLGVVLSLRSKAIGMLGGRDIGTESHGYVMAPESFTTESDC